MPQDGKKGGDDAIILSLAAGGSIAHAARQGGVSDRTVRRRLTDPAFRSRINEMRSELIAAAVGRLAMLGRKAADALNVLLDDANNQVRLGAARAVLQFMLQGHSNEVLAEQVTQLRKQFEELGRGTGNTPNRTQVLTLSTSTADGVQGADSGAAASEPGGMDAGTDSGRLANETTDGQDIEPLFGA
jgi:hypothetical protein